MRYFNESTLETIARNELKKYDTSLVVGEPRTVPIEDMAEYHFGLDMEYRLLRNNGLVLGCTVFNDTLLPIWIPEEKRYTLLRVNGGTVVIDASLLMSGANGRLRFTIAHELAHWLIHKELYSGEGIAAAHAVKTSMEENPAVERQANILATALLMPTGQVKKAFYRVRNTANPIVSLSKLFGVSKQAMGIFMQNHHLM